LGNRSSDRREHPGRLPEIYGNLGGMVMLRWALIFLVVALVAAVLGFGGVAGGAAAVAKILFMLFLVVFVISLIMGLVRRA
jgi:uncharacterized membrane protein YtjA (UPF0391 family)